MKQPFKKGTKIRVVSHCNDYWYKAGEIYIVHSYLPDEDAYVVEEEFEIYKESAWIGAEDVEMYIDWDSAPEGYDYWIVDNDGIMPSNFHKYVEDHERQGACYVDINRSYWTATCDEITVYKRPEEKEQEMNWFEKGQLPPVGTEFEYSLGNGYWFKAICNYVVKGDGVVALCQSAGGKIEQYLDVRTCKFRSIKSKEEQEKDEAIAEMVKVADPSGTLYNSASLFCERLYAAGWRKVE